MFIFYILIALLITSSHIHADDTDGRGADAKSTEVSVGCFSGDSTVILSDNRQKSIGYLQTGDEILTVDQSKVIPSEMIIMLDQERSKQVTFYTFQTASSHQISLTGLHLIPIISSDEQMNYIPAREVQLGDRLFVRIDKQFEYSSIINITMELKTGYFAPLTMTGTLLVNDVFVSCFASVKNHQMAQVFMTPFRWYYQISRSISLSDPFQNNRTDGIHWFIKIIYHFLLFIQPSSFQLF